jgi:hypothetical protein
MREDRMMGGKSRIGDDTRSFDAAFWRAATPEERVRAIFELRELYHEAMHPEIGAKGKEWIELLAALDAAKIRYLVVGNTPEA